ESAAPALRPVTVTQNVRPEEAESAGESAPTPEPVAADLSEPVAVHDRSGWNIDLAALEREALDLRLTPDAPQVLILHTHSSEAYTPDGTDRYVASDPYRTEDKTQSVIRVGDALAAALEESGLTVLHDREIYDYPSYTGSYSRSGAAVERWLSEYPSLRIVIDLHRDAIGSGDVVYRTRAVLDGTPCAQVMLLVGTGANGLSHPNWRENLKLGLWLQRTAEARCPGLMRPLEIVPERYNQQLSPGSLILEVGSTGNSLSEAVLAAEHFGRAVGPGLAGFIMNT
ncbi:MAG: stage II sporulation protein P, partial [Oscillospiraceae bacterium]|nr:stage II sporulation protein P [Oscillospiraceae bacterium]